VNPLNNKIKIRVNNFNFKHFSSIGYVVKLNDYIEIFVYELPRGSGTKIDVECNYCGSIFKKAYRRYLETVDDPCCEHCKQEKMMKTSLKNWGNKCSLRNPNVLEKAKKKNQENLGVDFPFQNKDILIKARKTLSKSGKTNFTKSKVSKQQLYIHNIFGGIINFSEFPYLLDILFVDENIYFEYDGGGHILTIKLGKLSKEEFFKKEKERELFLYQKGYKQFRIVSSDDILPSTNELLKIKDRAFYILLSENFKKYVYDLNSKTESFE